VSDVWEVTPIRQVSMRYPSKKDCPPLVAHIIQRLAVGGLENGLVNLINHMPEDRYRHIVLCLSDSTDYARRIKRQNVPVIPLHQRPGHDFSVHWRLLKLLIDLRPDIVHTRNLSGLEFLPIAALAGVRGRVHGEHGRDMHDLDGRNLKYRLFRKTIRHFVCRHTAVSKDLARWLVDTIGISPDRVTQIYNGVDCDRFRPRLANRHRVGPSGFLAEDLFVVGTVGRMQTVKNQLTLVRAFLHLIQTDPESCKRLRLVIIGDGPLRDESQKLLQATGTETLAWLPGERADIPELMREMNLFVLPSIAEGISNTILEAMATGLPVIATNVGGNPELVEDGQTGLLVPASDPLAMANAIQVYLRNPGQIHQHGEAARDRVKRLFSLDTMVKGYLDLYDTVVGTASTTEPRQPI
jgi:sugar transferase (PEP-CTERM/EpsH1 system associated)